MQKLGKVAVAGVQLRAVMAKEVRQTVRDPRMLALLLVAPVVQLVVFGFAANFAVDQVPTVVVDLNSSSTSRHLLQRLFADGTLVKAGQAPSAAAAETYLVNGRAALAVVLPADFSRRLARGETAAVQSLVDGSNPVQAQIAAAAVSRFFSHAQSELAARGQLQAPVVAAAPAVVAPRVLFNPRLASAVYMVPGISALLLLVVTLITVAMGLAREQEMGTIEQVLVTPMPAAVLLLGKMLPFVVVGLVDFGLAVLAGALIFAVPLGGDWRVLLGATLFYLLCTLSAGLLLGTYSKTQSQAFMGSFLVVLPAVLLSGIMTPIAGMPTWLRLVTYLNPVRYYAAIVRASLLKDAAFADVWPSWVALALLGVGLMGAATWRFRRVLL